MLNVIGPRASNRENMVLLNFPLLGKVVESPSKGRQKHDGCEEDMFMCLPRGAFQKGLRALKSKSS